MGFFKAGQETELADGTAHVTMQYEDGLELYVNDYPGTSVKVFHIETDAATGARQAADVTGNVALNADGTVSSVNFVLDGFSPVVIVSVVQTSSQNEGDTWDENPNSSEIVTLRDGTTAVELKSFITGMTVEYQENGTDAWVTYTEGTELPGNISVRLNAEFENLPWSALEQNGYRATATYSMPGFSNFGASSDILGPDNRKCGTLTAAEGRVLLTFDESYFVKSGAKLETIMGTFRLEAAADWKVIPGDGKVQVTVGDAQKELLFEDNLIARYSNMEVSKKAGNVRTAKDGEDAGYYIDYTVTLKATGDLTIPNVVLRDEFFVRVQLVRNMSLAPAMDMRFWQMVRISRFPVQNWRLRHTQTMRQKNISSGRSVMWN